MAEAIIWAEKLPDIIKKWILVIPMIITTISVATGGYHYIDKKEVEEQLKQTHEQITNVAEHLTKTQTPEVKNNCNTCRKHWQKDILNLKDVLEKRYHK